jgi:mRNA-degrading endonuclease RelE of RelBE toxin-antitoxin system
MKKGRKAALRPADKSKPELIPPPVFEIRYTADAGLEIKALDGSIREQLRKVIDKKLAVNPEGYGTPLRRELTNFWKHEFATHRVIYRIYVDLKIVAVCAVGPRKSGDVEDIYKQLAAAAKTGRLAGQVASVFSTLLPKKK